MFEFPWTKKARLRREAEEAEAAKVAKLLREEREQRAAYVLADQIQRSKATAMRKSAQVTPIRNSGLTAQNAAAADRKRRDDDTRSDSGAYDYAPFPTARFSRTMPEADTAAQFIGGGGTFDGGGSSGDWARSTDSPSPSDSGSSSSSDSSSSSSDSGSSSSGGSD